MNSPLVLFKDKLPCEIINYIQLYLINDFAHKAIQEYIHYLYYEQELYEDFVMQNYVFPNCDCHRYRKRECNACYEFEYTTKYHLSQYNVCIWNNKQLHNIRYGKMCQLIVKK